MPIQRILAAGVIAGVVSNFTGYLITGRLFHRFQAETRDTWRATEGWTHYLCAASIRILACIAIALLWSAAGTWPPAVGLDPLFRAAGFGAVLWAASIARRPGEYASWKFDAKPERPGYHAHTGRRRTKVEWMTATVHRGKADQSFNVKWARGARIMQRGGRARRAGLRAVLVTMTLVAGSGARGPSADAATVPVPRSIDELASTATLRVGKTADWVAIGPGAVWVGSTGPFAVHRIDATTALRVATVKLPGEPCAGLVIGFGSLWVPLCGHAKMLAKVDLDSNKLVNVFKIGPAAAEGGVAASADSIWLVVDKAGSLARIDPDTGAVRQTIRIPPGSYNPFYSDGQIWVTRAEGSEITAVDAATGVVSATVRTGPGPRFLTAGAGAVWTLNQGDGSLTRIDLRTKQATKTIALGIPGHGGDIGFGGGKIWTTVWNTPLSVIDGVSATLLCQWKGRGGDSLGIGDGAIWLTDYRAGTISRLGLDDALEHCQPRSGN